MRLALMCAAASLLALVDSGCAHRGAKAAAVSESPRGVQVTLLVYSGRRNPAFVLESRDDIERLRNALRDAKALPRFERATVVPSILGYNGIRVENGAGEGGLPRSFVTYRGTIEVHDGGTRFLSDTDRKLESVLVDQAARHGVASDALEIVRADLKASAPPQPPATPPRGKTKRRR